MKPSLLVGGAMVSVLPQNMDWNRDGVKYLEVFLVNKSIEKNKTGRRFQTGQRGS